MKDELTAQFFCTGVYATAEEIVRMKAEYNTPVMAIGGHVPCPALVMHECALAHGLPEIKGHYGCDFRDGEFIREKNALEGTPDSWEKPATDAPEASNEEDHQNTMWDFGPDDGG